MKVCLFDWDGTLLDNSLICQEATRHVFEVLGSVKRAPTLAEFISELEQHDGDYLKVYQARGVNASRDQLNEVYGPVYAKLVAGAQLNPGSLLTLRELSSSGVKLGLITTQLEHSVVPLMYKFEIYKLFRHFHFNSMDKSSAIIDVWEQHPFHRQDIFYVGDAPSDIRHANNARVVSVAYLNSPLPYNLVLAARPTFSIFHMTDLLKFIN